MSRKLIYLFFAVAIFPIAVYAADPQGLAPACTGLNCNYCEFLKTGDRIIQFLLEDIMFPVAAVIFVVGGITIMTAGESTSRYQKGRDMIKSTIIGIIIALLAWLVLDTIFNVLAPGTKSIVKAPWNELQCTTNANSRGSTGANTEPTYGAQNAQ